MDDKFYNRIVGDRISSRQIDELIGLARGLAADGRLNRAEVEFLQKWLAANVEISGQPVICLISGVCTKNRKLLRDAEAYPLAVRPRWSGVARSAAASSALNLSRASPTDIGSPAGALSAASRLCDPTPASRTQDRRVRTTDEYFGLGEMSKNEKLMGISRSASAEPISVRCNAADAGSVSPKTSR